MEPSDAIDRLAYRIIGAAIEVHRHLGPGVLESVYEGALAVELERRDIALERQVAVAVQYKGYRSANTVWISWLSGY